MRLWTVVLVAIGMSRALAGSEEPITINLVTNDAPPFSLLREDGTIAGMTTELLRKAFEKAQIDYTIAIFPWARAYSLAQIRQNTCVFATYRTEQRENLFKWIGPTSKADWTLFGLPDSPKLKVLDDARHYVIGGFYKDAETDYLKQQGFLVDEASDAVLNARKLVAHRIDYYADGLIHRRYAAKEAGIYNPIPILVFKALDQGVACNKTVPDKIIAKVNAALHDLIEDGTAAEINSRYE